MNSHQLLYLTELVVCFPAFNHAHPLTNIQHSLVLEEVNSRLDALLSAELIQELCDYLCVDGKHLCTCLAEFP